MDIAKDPNVVKWLRYYTKDKDVYDSKINYLRDFMKYIRIKADFKDATPSSLIDFQLNANESDKRTKYKILDILQEYINEKGGRASTQTTRYSIVKNFFKKNRAALPPDDFKPVPTVKEVDNNLNVEIIKRLISASDLEMKAVYLTLFMGILEREKFKEFNLNCGLELVKHLKTFGVEEPFKFDIPGRKGSKFRSKYYTFIGRDALEAWQEYFNNSERGWPKEGEHILYGRDGKPLTKDAISARHLRLLRKLQLIKSNNGGSATRHGYGLHNFRDEAKTHLHNRAKPEGFDMDYAEFWMGHITDPNRYDTFYRDEKAAVKHYKIAERFLNLNSGESADTKVSKEIEELRTRVEEMDLLGSFPVNMPDENLELSDEAFMDLVKENPHYKHLLELDPKRADICLDRITGLAEGLRETASKSLITDEYRSELGRLKNNRFEKHYGFKPKPRFDSLNSKDQIVFIKKCPELDDEDRKFVLRGLGLAK